MYKSDTLTVCTGVSMQVRKRHLGTSLAVQYLRLCALTAESLGSIPGRETSIPHSMWCSQKEKKNFFFLIRKRRLALLGG